MKEHSIKEHAPKIHASINQHYIRLFIMSILHFLAMYILMYTMVDNFSNALPNLNQFYMAGLMTSPMIVMEIFLMSSMYHDVKLNAAIVGVTALLFVLFFIGIRQQTAINDKEFLRSMIPHHAGAILMCNEASIENAEIKELCESITSGQQSEIDQMQRILNKLGDE